MNAKTYSFFVNQFAACLFCCRHWLRKSVWLGTGHPITSSKCYLIAHHRFRSFHQIASESVGQLPFPSSFGQDFFQTLAAQPRGEHCYHPLCCGLCRLLVPCQIDEVLWGLGPEVAVVSIVHLALTAQGWLTTERRSQKVGPGLAKARRWHCRSGSSCFVFLLVRPSRNINEMQFNPAPSIDDLFKCSEVQKCTKCMGRSRLNIQISTMYACEMAARTLATYVVIHMLQHKAASRTRNHLYLEDPRNIYIETLKFLSPPGRWLTKSGRPDKLPSNRRLGGNAPSSGLRPLPRTQKQRYKFKFWKTDETRCHFGFALFFSRVV